MIGHAPNNEKNKSEYRRSFSYLYVIFSGFSRRLLHQTSMGFSVLCILCVAILENFPGPISNVVSLVICMCGLAILEWQWDAVNLLAVELFPTVVRSSGLAFCTLIGRLGNVVAPQIVFLSHFWTPAAYLAFIIIGSISVILSVCFLPETKGKELPDNMNLESVAV